MTEPLLVAQTITISHNVAIVAASCFAAAGFMIGYAVAWRQRRDEPPRYDEGACSSYLGGPVDLDEALAARDRARARLAHMGAEDRVRRSQA